MCLWTLYTCEAYIWFICLCTKCIRMYGIFLCVFIYILFIFEHTILCTVYSFIYIRFMFSFFIYGLYICVSFMCNVLLVVYLFVQCTYFRLPG